MIYTYFLLFIIYSFFGWLIEIVFTFFKEKKLINRGFLIGPYCPIYGAGCLLLVWLLDKYKDNYLVLFVLIMFICSLVEYLTSFLMEKIFKLRWWDYSDMKFNINGRICLETMVPFALTGVIFLNYIHPFIYNAITKIPPNIKELSSIVILFIFLFDIIITCNVVFNIKSITKNLRKDSTEDINKAIKKLVIINPFMYERIIKAFPNMTKIIKNKTRGFLKHTKNKK